MENLIKKLLLPIFLLLGLNLFSGIEPLNTRLASAQILANNMLSVVDNKYPYEVPGQSVVKNSVASVVLGIDQDILANNFTKFSLLVNVQITAYDKNGAIISVPNPVSLLVKYDKTLGAQFQDRDVYVIKDCHRVDVKILSVQYTDVSNVLHTNPSVPPGITYMEAELNTERYYLFNPAYSYPITDIHTTHILTTNELEINWPPIDGAEDYDLEWTYVNDYDPPSSYIVTTSLNYSFKNSATRVTLSQNFFRISLMFEHGYLLYRVRPRGRDLTNTDVILYGNWNSCANSPCEANTVDQYGTSLVYALTEHDDYKNWQYSASYAEEGRKKEVVNYFDGSLHNRQSQTRINTNNNLIIGESLYDFQGRPAVNILPVPVQIASQQFFVYRSGFNLAATNNIFDKVEFDKDGTDSCDASIASILNTSGASKYYSPNNPDKNEQQAYVPDAQGYPFTQVEYTPDNTGRIRRQGGVGNSHQLGSNHETKYFYGQPEQSELDMLFGSEAGYYKHYKKNMVIDPNGQISNTYIDMYGKTIATSLSGKPPLSMDSISGSAYKTIKSKYIYPNTTEPNPNVKINDNTIQFTKDLVVSTESDYDFKYDLDKEIYSITCTSTQMCFNCIYDLSISVVDECGKPVTTALSVQSIGTLDTTAFTCNSVIKFNTTPSPYTVHLLVGNYKVIKTLTANEAVANIYTDQYIRKDSCIKKLSDFTSAALAQIDLSGCHVDCQMCLDSLGTISMHNDPTKADPNNVAYDPSYVYMTQAQFDAATGECKKACAPITECDVLYQLMLADVSPSGQYAQYDVSPTSYDATTYPLSVLNTANVLPMSTTNDPGNGTSCVSQPYNSSLANYKNPKITIGNTIYNEYRDADGNPARVYLNQISPGVFSPDYDPALLLTGPTNFDTGKNQYYIAPQELRYLKDFVNAFSDNTSWARSLVEYHPEWGYYGLCSKLQDTTFKKNGMTSEEFDDALRATTNYSDAVNAGFIDNTNTTTRGARTDLYLKDPFFYNDLSNGNIPFGDSTYFGASTFFRTTILYNYKNSGKTIKQIATQIARCNNVYYGSLSSCTGVGFGDPSYAYGGSQDAIDVLNYEWKTYRDLYLGEKQKLVKNVINQFAKGSFESPNYAKDNGFYNGPIGIGNEYYNPWEHDMIVFSNVNPFWWWGWTTPFSLVPTLSQQMSNPACYGYGYLDPAQPSFYNTWQYYVNKTKRYVTGSEGLPSGMNINALSSSDQTDLQNMTNYNIYQATGQCTGALTLESFLNEIVDKGTFNVPYPASVPLVLNGFFTQDMYNTLISSYSTYQSMDWQTTISGNTFTGNFINSTTGSPITLTYIGPGSFTSTWWSRINYFSDITYISQNPSNVYNFNIKAFVDTDSNPLTAPEQKDMAGTTSFVVGGCTFADYCQPSQTASQLLGLMNALNSNGDILNTSGVTISGNVNPYSTVLTNKLIKPFLPISTPIVWTKIGATSNPINATMVGAVSAGFQFDYSALVTAGYTFTDIQFFKSIKPDASDQNKFTLSAMVGVTNSVPVFLPVLVTIIPPASSPLYPLGTCGPPPGTACNSPQNQTLKDMEAFLKEMLGAVLPSSSLDLSYLDNYTALLHSYVAGPSSNIWNASFTSPNILNATIGTGPTACSIKFKPASNYVMGTSPYTYGNITAFSNIYADYSQLNAGGYPSNFYITAQFGSNATDTLRLYVTTSCFQFKNCIDCPANISGPSVAENFDTYTSGSSTTPPINTNGDFNYTNSTSCSISSNNFNILNEVTQSSGCSPSCNANEKDHSGILNKNYMHLNWDFSASSTAWTNGYFTAWANTAPPITISNNTNYEFSCWYRHCAAKGNMLSLVAIDNSSVEYPLATVSLLSTVIISNGEWHQLKGTWNSGNNTQVNIQVRITTDGSGNQSTDNGVIDLDEVVFRIKPCTSINESNPSPVDSIATYEPCDTMLTSIGYANALYDYEQYINDQKKNFKEAYLAHCLSAFETFSVQYTDRQHHYTLYYYDQSGNLIKTIPPAGVELINLSATLPSSSVTYGTAIANDRVNKTQTIFTQHRMATVYEYNSLNQLIKQTMPDHDAINNWQLSTNINNTPPTLPTNVVINDMDFNGQNGFLVGIDGSSNGVIYSTTDGGATWNPASSVGFGNLNKVQDAGSSIIYAVADGGALLKSTNSGSTWSALSLGGPTSKINDLYFFNTTSGIVVGDNGAIYSTSNGGTTWSPITIGQGSSNLNAIHFTNSSNGYIVGNSGKLFYTLNGGTTWAAPAVLMSSNINLTDVQFYPPVSTALVTSGSDDLISGFVTGYDATTNAGKTIFIKNLKSIYYQSPSTNYLNTVNYSSAIFNNGVTPAKQLNGLSITDAGTTNTYTDDYILAGGKNGELYKVQYNTTLSSWTGALETLPSGFNAEITQVVYPSISSANPAFATAKNGAVLSYNGTAWSANTANTIPLNGIYFNSSDVYAVGTGGTILKSTNTGVSFSNVTQLVFSPLNAVSIAKDNSGLVVAVGDGGTVMRSTNNGSTWTASTAGSGNLNAVWSFNTSSSILAGQSGNIYKLNGTTSSGVTSPVSSDLNDLFFLDNSNGYSVGNSGVILKTTNAGTSWSSVTSPLSANLKSIHAKNTTIMAAGASGKIARSVNGGAFTDISPTSISTANLNRVHLNDNLTAFAFGASGTILKTFDGGDNWSLQSTTSGISYNAVVFTENGTALLGGSGTNNLFQASNLTGDYSTRFWYDRLGRLIISQNAKQFNKSTKAYSYTKYDALGRITEVGENATTIDPQTLTNYNSVISESNYSTWVNAGTKTEVTSTLYDNAVSNPLAQQNLRKRVSAVYIDNNNNLSDGYQAASYYSYDVHGNVDDMVQENPLMPTGQTFKEIKYDYDLVSGKVNEVKYQDGQPDAFYHKYLYDADNRITNVYTSRNNVLWEQDAKYFYYKHGPLARTELGDEKVQGTDYAYTIHGWIKGVNSTTMKELRDQGKDGIPDQNALLAYNTTQANLNSFISKDAFGYGLNYYNTDYNAISVNPASPTSQHKYDVADRFDADISGNSFFSAANHELFNGNIAGMATAIPSYATSFNFNANTQLSAFKYDQLNRIKQAIAYDANGVITSNAWASASTVTDLYKNVFTYDANGNILTQDRYDDSGTQFDQMQYQYDLDANSNPRKNRLYHVNDNTGISSVSSTDIDNQGTFTPAATNNLALVNTANNYGYDELGNLVRDNQEEIDNIEWTVYGKIKSITRTGGSHPVDLEYVYDAGGNRIVKIIKPRPGGNPSSSSLWDYTFYIRDAQGNLMAIYEDNKSTSTYNLKEHALYGNSHLGQLNNTSSNYAAITQNTGSQYQFNRNRGYKSFELNNHLGNVLSVVSDRRTAIASSGVTIRYEAEILSATDYYAFGGPMPGRNTNSNTYRYGFNGKENDNEVKGDGNQQDYGMRIYDPRLGKFLSVDPLYKAYPELSDYQYASNNPVQNIDLDGLEGLAGNMAPMPLGGPLDADNDGKLSKSELKGGAKIFVTTAVVVVDVLVTKGRLGTAYGLYSWGEGVGNGEKSAQARKAGDYVTAEKYSNASKEGYAGFALTFGPSLILNSLKTGVGLSIALGKNINLIKFAQKTSSTSFHNFDEILGYKEAEPSFINFEDAFKYATDAAIKTKGKILFNLEYVNLQVVGKIKSGTGLYEPLESLGGKSLWESNMITEWELRQVLDNKQLLESAEFYKSGVKVPTSTVTKKIE